MRLPSRTSMRGALVAALAVIVLGLASPAGAGGWRGHAVGTWGWHWGGHHHRHGFYARGHGSHFAFALSLALPLFGYRDHEPRYAYPVRPGRVVVHERAPPAVVYRQPSVVAGYLSAQSRRAVPPGCREFNTQITIAGRREAAWGIACPQADGSWRVVD